MRIDVLCSSPNADVAVEIDMAGVEVDVVRVQCEIDVRERASLVRVLVGMRVDVSGAVAVRVGVHGVGMVVVGGAIRMRNIGVVLIPRVCVIAVAAVQVIGVGHIAMVLVRGVFSLVVVIAMLDIPEVLVRRMLRRAIQMARAGSI